MMKQLTKIEQFICQMIWGGIPMTKNWGEYDVEFIRNSNYFKQGVKTYESGEWDKYK